jgi:hypothetical protein
MTTGFLIAHLISPALVGAGVGLKAPRHWGRWSVATAGAIGGVAIGAIYDALATLAGA